MRGKVKFVKRNIWLIENKLFHWSSEVRPLRSTVTYAVLYNDHRVGICEDDIRAYYRRERITTELIHSLDKALHNKWIEYDKDKYTFKRTMVSVGEVQNYTKETILRRKAG